MPEHKGDIVGEKIVFPDATEQTSKGVSSAEVNSRIATHAGLPTVHQNASALITTHKGDASAHHAESHGADKHTNVTRELFIPANEGCIYYEAGRPSSASSYGIVEGGANADEPEMYFTIKVPDDFVSFVSVKAVWSTPGPVGTGNIYWHLDAVYASYGEPLNTHTETTGKGVTAGGGPAVLNAQESPTPLVLADLVKGDQLGLYFYREGSNALDTIDTIMAFYGLLFTYIAEQ